MKIISGIRKNIGTIIASFGFLALCIITFGDLGEIMTEQYWQNVLNNMTSIGFMTIALTMIQVAIKQGIAEQALQRGLNTETTTQKWKEHRDIIKNSQERIIFMPYFLQVYNDRQTRLRKREFLVNNNYSSESALLKTGNKRHIRKYHDIRVFLTVARIKWATTEIVYNKHGQIQTLQEYRSARLGTGIIRAFIFMIGITFLTTGLFMSITPIPLWQKFVKLGTYVLTISMSSVYAIVKAYEKGAFSVPNELEELNAIWQEFAEWKTPDWVIKEVEEFNQVKEVKNAQDNQTKKGDNARTALQDKPQESEVVSTVNTDSVICLPCSVNTVPDSNPDELGGECDERPRYARQRTTLGGTDSSELSDSKREMGRDVPY